MFSLAVDNEITLTLCNRFQAPQLYALVNEQKAYLSQWLPWPEQTKSLDDYLRFITASLHQYAENTGMVCFILYQEELVGCAGFNVINHTLKKAEIGYWLSQRHQGLGIMTRTCRYLVNFAFMQLDLEKVEIRVAEQNRQSRAVCERLGFAQEGIVGNSELLHGLLVSHVCYGMQCRQWQEALSFGPGIPEK